MKVLAGSIRRLRQKKGMTQAQLAAMLGVQYQTVSKWETGVTVPDTAMLPRIADVFDESLDCLFGREQTGCEQAITEEGKDFLLMTYARMYGPEALNWNMSVENKYLEYRFTDFFERHFPVAEGADICNIGIGAGEWDHYLTTKLKNGTLTSIDKLEICCRQLQLRLALEQNPGKTRVICADAMDLSLEGQFDIVTMVGSTVMESGVGRRLLEKAISFLKDGGALYYQSLDPREDPNGVLQTAFRRGAKLGAFAEDQSHGLHCRYYRLEKP